MEFKPDTDDNTEFKFIEELQTAEGKLSAWCCIKNDVPVWDEFLDSIPGSHFYQTSMWARVRILDGWQPLITLITLDGRLISGFQILTRNKKYIGKIGLLLKGPVSIPNEPNIKQFLIRVLRKVAGLNKIRALIIQPPDKGSDMIDLTGEPDFYPNVVKNALKDNTVVIDLRGDEDTIFKAIKRTRRQNINSAIRQGVIVREGNRDELGVFFNYMLATCERQRVDPSPSSLQFIETLWDIFSVKNHVKMFVSEYQGKIISCLIAIPFSDTAYLWKFGWSGEDPKLYANVVIYWEIFRWAKAGGLCFADLGAVDSDLAHELLQKKPVPKEKLNTYSRFKVGFGGNIISLTNGYIYVPNKVIGLMYRTLTPYINSFPFLRKKVVSRESKTGSRKS